MSDAFALSRDDFSRSFFELGSGTCLAPLLRFSDLTRHFTFIDYTLDVAEVHRNLKRAEQHLHRAAHRSGIPAPLRLENIQVFPDLRVRDFELISTLDAANARVRAAFTQVQYRNFIRVFDPGMARQWGVFARVVRCIARIDQPPLERVLTLKVFGGEGLLTYVGMGGLERPPLVVSTVQTGILEQADGPLARIFRDQSQAAAPLPRVWIRGQAWRNAWPPWSRVALTPAPPFSMVGQAYAGWMADRQWPGAPDLRRVVQAWIREPPSVTSAAIGPHRFIRQRITPTDLARYDAAFVPHRLAVKLGVADAGWVYTPRSGASLAPDLGAWMATDAFAHADQAVVIPSCFEDELVVLAEMLRTRSQPAITVFLPMPMDFEAALRCV